MYIWGLPHLCLKTVPSQKSISCGQLTSVCPLETRQLLALQVCRENTVGIWDAQQETLPAFSPGQVCSIVTSSEALGALEDAQLSPGTASSALGWN